MASKKTLGITGAFGYIGKRLLARLAETDAFDQIICTDILDPPSALADNFLYFNCDVRDGRKLHGIFEKTGVNAVVHLAFIAYPTRDPGFEYDVDVLGTKNVLTACEALNINRLVTASSDCAYGFFENTPDYLTEEAPVRATPGFPYSENKAEIEKLIAEYAKRVPDCRVVVLRPCMVMGPTVDNTTSNSMKQPAIIGIRGYDPIMQFVHEDDAAEAFYLALVKTVEGTFNLAADKGLRYSELAAALGKKFVALPVWLVYPIVEALYRLRLLPFGKAQLSYIRYPLSMNVEKIQKELGFSPRYTSIQVLKSFLETP